MWGMYLQDPATSVMEGVANQNTDIHVDCGQAAVISSP